MDTMCSPWLLSKFGKHFRYDTNQQIITSKLQWTRHTYDTKFTIDSGATRHCVGNELGMVNFRRFNGTLEVAGGRVLQATGIGGLHLELCNGTRLTIRNVWLVP